MSIYNYVNIMWGKADGYSPLKKAIFVESSPCIVKRIRYFVFRCKTPRTKIFRR